MLVQTMELECKNKYIMNKQKMLPYAIFWEEFSVSTDAIVILRCSYSEAVRILRGEFNRDASDASG